METTTPVQEGKETGMPGSATQLIREQGGTMDYYDPFTSAIPLTREHPEPVGEKSIADNMNTIATCKAIFILTD
jgi:UDP-N-acetyl-D-glucosamine dehydrogenase